MVSYFIESEFDSDMLHQKCFIIVFPDLELGSLKWVFEGRVRICVLDMLYI